MDVYQDGTDVNTLKPFLETTKENLNIIYTIVVADADYESEENYVYLKANKQESFIKRQNYEKTKKCKKLKYTFAKMNFKYDEERDIYVCPGGEKLTLQMTKKSKSATGYESVKSVYYIEKCLNCPYRDQCTKSKDGIRKIEHSKVFHKHRQQSFENITTEKGIN